MELPITALFTGLLGLWYVRLALLAIGSRAKAKVRYGMGSESDSPLVRDVRAHANFNEYIPLLIIMMALLEFHGMIEPVLYAFGALVLLGRIVHRKGITQDNVKLRIRGMHLTLWPLAIASVFLVVVWLVDIVMS